jgi:hypothetical protein
VRYNWSDGSCERGCRCYDRATGEEIKCVLWYDTETRQLARLILDARGLVQYDPRTVVGDKDGTWERIGEDGRPVTPQLLKAFETRELLLIWDGSLDA